MRTAILAFLLIPLLAFADSDAKFAALRDKASPLDGSLASFLDRYIGECGDLFEGQACKKNSQAYREKMNGKKYYVIVPEDAATMLQAGPYNPAEDEYTVLVTPFFPGGGYALTQGAPRKVDRQGNPVLPLIVLHGKLPEGWDLMSFKGLFRRRELRVQLVFTPQGVWSLPKKGGGKMYGVKAKIEGLLVTYARTGNPVASYYANQRRSRR